VEARKVIDGRSVKPGDAVIGLPSSGIHSNGYSLVRAIVRGKKVPPSIRKELLRPTRIYVRQILRLLKRVEIRGMAHITGGGIEGNLPRVFPRGTAAEIDRRSWHVPKIFPWLQKQGNVSDAEMFRTFNMGIGFAVVVRRKDAPAVLRFLAGSKIIGRVVRRPGEPGVVWKN
jgi:phosphoribosylformylglycinamidine cyclo-ligase